MTPALSLVVSTYNRLGLLQALLDAVAKQTLPAEQFEVVVVDDGSREPVAPALEARKDPFSLTVVTQANAGAAAARHAGVLRARGEVIVITDDDMLVPPDFLAAHLAAHRRGYTLVLGQIADEPGAAQAAPLFERMHFEQLHRFVAHFREHPTEVRGVMVCTGNVSFRRAEYLAVGGFDGALKRSEDRELGVRLQKAGAKLYFCEAAKTYNRSDHTDLSVWLGRSFNYGVYDSRIHHKHPDRLDTDPWHFMFLVNPVSRVLLWLPVAAPGLGHRAAQLAYAAAEALDRRKGRLPVLGKVALAGATLTYGLEYFRGVRVEAGSARQALTDFARHAVKHLRAARG